MLDRIEVALVDLGLAVPTDRAPGRETGGASGDACQSRSGCS
jgi:hypothetical protein